MEGVLLESLEGLGESPVRVAAGEWWELLQAEKEGIANEIVADGPLAHDARAFNECEPWDDTDEHMQRQYRCALESRLRELNDAQDRLIDGGYGLCTDCGDLIGEKRLRANPAASLCIGCQQFADREQLRRVS